MHIDLAEVKFPKPAEGRGERRRRGRWEKEQQQIEERGKMIGRHGEEKKRQQEDKEMNKKMKKEKDL